MFLRVVVVIKRQKPRAHVVKKKRSSRSKHVSAAIQEAPKRLAHVARKNNPNFNAQRLLKAWPQNAHVKGSQPVGVVKIQKLIILMSR